MFNPLSTYRIQFHKNFTFAHLEKRIPYLQQLGVGTVYASPVFEALPGSVHGYDIVNPLRINPEIGTEEELRQLRKKLNDAGINWLQDIVPNHAAYHSKNKWLMDVLEKGQQSVYAPFFDTVMNSRLFSGKLMVPFLGSTLEEVISNGELRLAFEEGRFVFKHYDNHYPLKPGSYPFILQTAEGNDAINSLLVQIDNVHKLEDSNSLHKGWDELLLQLHSLMRNETVKAAVQQAIDNINNDKEKIRQLANEQHYRFCHWQETDSRINYRRFFTVNGLICLNIQDENVFEKHHSLVKKLANENIFQGLRVDHVDGLYNPTEYLQRLRQLSGQESCIVVEKILEAGEDMPTDWPVQGNTGYDFLSAVNNLFTNKDAEPPFTEFYEGLTDDYRSLHQQLHDKKTHILYEHMGGELENLYRYFLQLNIADKKFLARIPPDDMKSAIGEFLIQCPVYRCYGNFFPLNGNEEKAVRNILQGLRRSGESKEAVTVLENVFLHRPHEGKVEVNENIAKFYQRCMQFTGPLMAKGVEDTLMYTYNRFIGHNEVGDSPDAFGDTVEEFHRKMQDRQQRWPLSLNATATHDTKRGEDSRARLNVLTDLHEEWLSLAAEWKEINKGLKRAGAPDANDEYLVYQVLVGNYPMPGENEDDFANRLQDYLQKALREAKTHSNWTTPNEEYENATKNFAVALLDKGKPFWKSFTQFQQKIVDHGIINSLSQVLLKFTCPGVPDVYQGCEFWDFSFVDPDNRRAVDYQKRIEALQSFAGKTDKELLPYLVENRYGAQAKLWLLQQVLHLRKRHPDVFTEGEYVPLQVEGKYRQQVLAFARRHKGSVYAVAVPLHTAALSKEQGKDFFSLDWADTKIHLPAEIQGRVENIFTRKKTAKSKGLLAKELFQHLPFALLKARLATNERGAGVLVHISSLPSLFGVGDMGPEAKVFADFLYHAGQKYWQLLPLNPTEAGQGHSPYSALSSKAGYPLLISPEALVKDALLSADELQHYYLPQESKVNYSESERVKNELLEKAFASFVRQRPSPLHEAFKKFNAKEKHWLDDFALFMLLKKLHNGKPWFEWPEEYKKRDVAALKKLAVAHKREVRKIKWLQFIFTKQWRELKDYCNGRNVQLIGDIPFYISYDSADVWAHTEIFAVDEEGQRTGIAGVPPDAFSADGQLWGMPVFKWDVLKETGYAWWIERLKKNIELFDLVRLDHFRAFAGYWDVPAGEQTARNGQWKSGPGADFFNAIENALGQLPFVAEDLGDITEDVLHLRDEFRLPGMKVLQFAFGEDMPQSDYIPHNYDKNFLVYSGTHDNNTTVGWYRTEAGEDVKRRINHYHGCEVNEQNVSEVFARMAYGSVAQIAILPVQDVLGLDESARMNTPSSGENNWVWRLTPGQVNAATERQLLEWTKMYNRL
ncbi:malto-oligosyltrehalose synthase [Flavisolibacter ginsenosidimutans]|uniref:4-alpha-glucanotransferase n=1 Tax=Flavisolibacter ginsenosidimutans TaxID=661481 RepID=A0A5B8UIV3_9BACT|nr:malto-oligosyltrehalose synthase [Flavisolibacter ginsenosidimutans]QEC55935.1 malto-oligosyltrehalose synthase [Flavisolibacter ginsenosidimutans]